GPYKGAAGCAGAAWFAIGCCCPAARCGQSTRNAMATANRLETGSITLVCPGLPDPLFRKIGSFSRTVQSLLATPGECPIRCECTQPMWPQQLHRHSPESR